MKAKILILGLFLSVNVFSQSFKKYGFEVYPSLSLSKQLENSDDNGNISYGFASTIKDDGYTFIYNIVIIDFKNKIYDLETYFSSAVTEYNRTGALAKLTTYKGEKALLVNTYTTKNGVTINQRSLCLMHNNKSYMLNFISNSLEYESKYKEFIKCFKYLD